MLVLATMLAAAAGGPPYRQSPATGVRHYVYEAIETVVGGPVHGYRTEFDLENSKGEIYAIIRSSSVLDGSWKPVDPDTVCRAAMHGSKTRLARVKLFPLSDQVARSLGEAFLPTCAPLAVFLPLTDILNVILIPTSHFRATELAKVGQSLTYDGFDAKFDRPEVAVHESSSQGEISLASLDASRATLDWKPALADLEITEKINKPLVTLKGTEHFAFRVEVNRKTGTIEQATSSYDDLDMTVMGAPNTRLRITRAVAIKLRDD